MTTRSWLNGSALLLRCSMVLCSCGGPASTDETLPELGATAPAEIPRPHRMVVAQQAPDPDKTRRGVVAWPDSGKLTLLDSTTGDAIAETALPSQGRAECARDLAWDRFRHRVLLFESDEEEQAGEIGTVEVHDLDAGKPRLGSYQHRAWVDGRARLWPVRGGMVVFEEGYGERWKLLRDDAVPTASIAAPRPASVWSALAIDGSWVEAFTYGPSGNPPAFQRARAWVSPEGIDSLCTEPLGVPPSTVPLTARLAPFKLEPAPEAPHGGVLVDLRGGRPVLRMVGPGAAVPEWLVSTGQRVERVEQALVLPGVHPGDRRILAALLSGPSRLLVATFDPSLNDVHAVLVALPGRVRVHDRFFARDLLAVGVRRVLAATDEGVWAIAITVDAAAVHATLDELFDGSALRGPLAGPIGRLHPRPAI